MSNNFDTLVIGPISLDHNIDYLGNERKEVGGAIIASGYAASNSGNKTALFTKFNPKDIEIEKVFSDLGAELFWKPSSETTSIRNKYFTPDKERRECTSMGRCDSFTLDEIPEVKTSIYHFAGLTYGDFTGELFRAVKNKGKVAVDIQCMLRRIEPDKTMKFYDWEEKLEYMPDIDFLKTDAAESEILTGCTDRVEAAKILYGFGAKEIMISHHTEVLIYDGKKISTCPIKARNLSGRTGRGDTCFSAYITERLTKDIPEALIYATALVSLKMEAPGPFKGTREDVLDYITSFYPDMGY